MINLGTIDEHPLDRWQRILSELDKLESHEPVVEEFTIIRGPIYFGKNVFVGAHSFLRGPLYIGDNVRIGSYNELTRTVILNNSKTSHFNFIADSFIGENCWIAGMTSTGNLKMDKSPVSVFDRNKNIKYADKFGIVIEDNVNIGGWVSIMPGTYVSAGKTIVGPSVLYGFNKFECLRKN